jgi:gas vesicle protein
MKLSSFIAGMGIGAGVALLLAPRSGDETLEMISKRVGEGGQYAKDRVQELRDVASDTAEQGKKSVARKARAAAAAAGAAKDTYARESQAESS